MDGLKRLSLVIAASEPDLREIKFVDHLAGKHRASFSLPKTLLHFLEIEGKLKGAPGVKRSRTDFIFYSNPLFAILK